MAWVRRDDDRSPGSFRWCAEWLGPAGLRALFEDGGDVQITRRPVLRAKLKTISDVGFVQQCAHIYLEHFRQTWRLRERVKERRRPWHRIPENIKREIAAWLAFGDHPQVIADAYRIDRDSVRRIARDAGITPVKAPRRAAMPTAICGGVCGVTPSPIPANTC